MLLCETVAFATLDQLGPGDAARVGGKAYNCARLKQAGLPVPDGLAVPADATDDEVRCIPQDAWLDGVPRGTRFAVRSSGLGEDTAGHSFAGIHETQLNVDRNQLAEAVLVCRRSAATDQARAYRQARALSEDAARIGVLVQCMVPAVVSGVAFTLNPITGADELVINAAPGLGEALVSGLVTPDEYRLSKNDLHVIERRKASDACGPLDLMTLGALLLRIEREYGAPQDVEWCHDGLQYWIVQSRPVTTHAAKLGIGNSELGMGITSAPQVASVIPDSSFQIPNSAAREVEWTRANLAEVLPDQLSPQALDTYQRILDVGERAFFGRLMAPESELGPIIKSFHGRLYFNLAQLRHVTDTVGVPFAGTLRSMGHSGQIRPEDEIVKRPRPLQLLRALPDLFRMLRSVSRAERIFRRHQTMTDRAIATLNARDPRTLPDVEIWAQFQWWLDLIPETLSTVFVMSSVQLHEDVLRKACRKVGIAYDDFVYPQLAAGDRSISTQQAVDLVELANAARIEAAAMDYLLASDATFADFRSKLAGTAFLRRFERFLEAYGHRGRYESDWALPRLHDDPSPALFAVRGQLLGDPQDPRAMAERQEAKAAEARNAFDTRLTWWQRLTLAPRVRSRIQKLKQQYVWREHVRSDLTRVLARIRVWHLTLADRFVERGWIDRRGDYFLLHLAEVRRACEEPAAALELRAIARQRAVALAAERDLEMPLFMRASELESMLRAKRPAAAATGDSMSGLCVSPGSIEAEVVVMRDPGEFAAMKPGAILVTRATDPSWTPLFTLASGVIVEVGGMLSHASTIAREYGLPALANVKDATRRLKTGDRVRLDASGGQVLLLA
jgi:rifampicin phosphotransferase